MKSLKKADLSRHNRKFFFDTEFLEVGSTIYPISLGIVTLDLTHQFYIEIDSPWREHANEWTLAHVAPHLDNYPFSVEQVRQAICEWVGDKPAEFWAYFSAHDWVVLCQIMGGLLNLPKNWSPFVRDLAWLDPDRRRIHGLRVSNPKPHHALFDAIELRDRYVELNTVLECEKV